MSNPSRRHLAHGVVSIPAQPTIVAVTVCTRKRARWLTDDLVHERLVELWSDATAWLTGRYVLMPDHLHLFAAENGDVPLDNWVRYWKSMFTKQDAGRSRQWHSDHWDRRMRSAAEYEDAWNYILWNPARAKLANSPDEWRFSGQIYHLPWD